MGSGDKTGQQRRRRQRRSGWQPFSGDALAQLGFGTGNSENRASEALIAAGFRCAVPGCESTDLTWDHIVPLANGGSRKSASNRQVLCVPHNAMKGNRSQEEFQAMLGVTWETATPPITRRGKFRDGRAWLVDLNGDTPHAGEVTG